MQLRNNSELKALCVGLMSIGVILRCYHYLMSRSLWVDEAMVGLNIINSSFADLMRPLQYGQLKPIGFLFIEKCFVEMFGKSEYALRAFPLICGILSILIFYIIAKKIFDRSVVVLLSLGMFVFADRLIYYSSEVQPYSSDVFFTLILIWLFLLVIETNYSRLYALILLLIGTVSVWISLPSAFVLASIGGVCIYQFFKKQQKISLYYAICCGTLWLVSFGLHYSILKYNLLHYNEKGVYAWFEGAGTFMPLLPLTPSDVRWYINTFFNVFADQPTRWFLPGLCAFCYISGLLMLYRKKIEFFFILLLPVIFTLFASGLKLYPFYIRWILFLVPLFILLIARGLQFLVSLIRPQSKILVIVLIFIFFLQPVALQIYRLMHPLNGEEIKPVLQFVENNIQYGDTLYIYYGAKPAFRYYCKRYNLCNFSTIIGVSGRQDLDKYVDDLMRLHGKGRIWFVFSHVPDWLSVNPEQFYLYFLNRAGPQLKEVKAHGASAYLYQL